jgi:tRNA nucleotidyltransferase/poly(A) polymerase
LTGHKARSTLAADGERIALPEGFTLDQGALLAGEDALPLLSGAPEGLVAVVCAAATHRLHIGRATADLIGAAAPTLRGLPPRRRGVLLLNLVLCARPADAVDLAVRCGLLRQLLPDIGRLRTMPKGQGRYKDVYVHTLRVLDATPPDPITRLAALLHDIAKPDTLVLEGGVAHFPNHDLLGADRAERRLSGLGFDPAFAAAVGTLVRLHLRANSYEPNWTDSAVRRLHLDAGEHWPRLLDLSHADVTSARPEVVARARRRVQALAEHARALEKPVEVSPLDGIELMERFGRGPGRWIGEVKRELIARVRDGSLDPEDRDAAWRVATEIVGAPPPAE